MTMNLNTSAITDGKNELFKYLIVTLRGSFNESIDWNGFKDELVDIHIPYNFQLRPDLFYITIHDLSDSFILTINTLRVSRSHYLRFRTLVSLSHNGELG